MPFVLENQTYMVDQALVPVSLYDHIPLWSANHGNNFRIQFCITFCVPRRCKWWRHCLQLYPL